MTGFNILRATTGLAMIFWCGVSLAAPHRHNIHGHRARHSRSEQSVAPFQITVATLHQSPNSTHKADELSNLSTYLVGDGPSPGNPAQLTGFIAQESGNGPSTTYFPPPVGAGGAVVNSVPATAKMQAGSTSFNTPGTVNSGRIYVVDGSLNFYASADKKIVHPDPHNPTDIASQEVWGFVEFTHGKDPSNGNENMIVNLSFVDWVSLPLGMTLKSKGENGTDVVETIGGLQPDALVKVCEALSALPGFWPKLCMRSANSTTPLRVMSPEKYISLHSDDKEAADYYEPYIEKAWGKYNTTDLKINTQTDGPDSTVKVDNGQIVTCRVGQDDILHCDSGAGDFPRPVSRDIYGCNSGPFSNPANGATESWSRARVRPRLCAAFVRSTLHLDGIQPSQDVGPDKYYQDPVTNHYAKVVHENLIDGSGYAFSYDDVNPGSAENSAGLIMTEHPIQLDIHVNV